MRFLLLYSIILIIIFGQTASTAATVQRPLKVHVSIPPQKYLVERIGGNKVEVTVLLKQGMNPETYEPTPKQMTLINASRLYFRVGVPFEDIWMDRISELNPELRIIQCCSSQKWPRHKHMHGDAEDYIYESHVWTSPRNVSILARIIKETLIDIDEVNAGYYEDNFRKLIEDLEELDKIIMQNLDGLRHRLLIVSHPSWGYFAETYGLEQIPVERHGSEIRARELANLVQLINKHEIKTIYVQPQYITTAARVLARETGARIIEIDPLAENYIDNLEKVSLLIKEGNS